MPLINPQEMTEANLAAKRANGSMSRGPATPEGKAHSAAANLRHGFYCQAQNGALTFQPHELTEAYRKNCQKFTQQLNEMASPENLAAQIAPQDEQSMLMQRMEDSSLRKLWRLTNMLVKVRNGALAHKDVKNEGRSDYGHENTGNRDKMSCDETGFSHENAPVTP